ncbi:MAG: hypothetical protein OFPI_27770 [Osedax symbiont Rs2]|nr:MAG: hypothetical protein OFPI_27770 [Osedax symbiont Rs2]
MKQVCIVVSGLPASGKTTLARGLSESMSLPMLDKDSYLELLFSQRGVGDSNWRQKLSREADKDFSRAAISAQNKRRPVILVSHWRPTAEQLNFGTPTQWIEHNFSKVIELYCQCPVEIAAARFSKRVRHRGHLDLQKSASQIVEWLTAYSQYLPLNLATTITVDTASGYRLEDVIQQLSVLLAETVSA